MAGPAEGNQRRLLAALAASLLLHAAPLLPGWRVLDDPVPPPAQLFLQTRLVDAAPAAAKTEPKAGPAQAPRPAGPPPAPAAPAVTPLPVPAPTTEAAPAPPEPPAAAATPPAEATEEAARLIEAATVPEYPREALAARIEACVLAEVEVGTDGTVTAVRIVASERPGIFDAAVIAAYRQARYLPATRNGGNVASRVFAVAGFELAGGGGRRCAALYAPQLRQLAGSATEPAR